MWKKRYPNYRYMVWNPHRPTLYINLDENDTKIYFTELQPNVLRIAGMHNDNRCIEIAVFVMEHLEEILIINRRNMVINALESAIPFSKGTAVYEYQAPSTLSLFPKEEDTLILQYDSYPFHAEYVYYLLKQKNKWSFWKCKKFSKEQQNEVIQWIPLHSTESIHSLNKKAVECREKEAEMIGRIIPYFHKRNVHIESSFNSITFKINEQIMRLQMSICELKAVNEYVLVQGGKIDYFPLHQNDKSEVDCMSVELKKEILHLMKKQRYTDRLN